MYTFSSLKFYAQTSQRAQPSTPLKLSTPTSKATFSSHNSKSSEPFLDDGFNDELEFECEVEERVVNSNSLPRTPSFNDFSCFNEDGMISARTRAKEKEIISLRDANNDIDSIHSSSPALSACTIINKSNITLPLSGKPRSMSLNSGVSSDRRLSDALSDALGEKSHFREEYEKSLYFHKDNSNENMANETNPNLHTIYPNLDRPYDSFMNFRGAASQTSNGNKFISTPRLKLFSIDHLSKFNEEFLTDLLSSEKISNELFILTQTALLNNQYTRTHDSVRDLIEFWKQESKDANDIWLVYHNAQNSNRRRSLHDTLSTPGSSSPIGLIVISKFGNASSRIIDCVIAPAHHGLGYATEACKGVMKHFFLPRHNLPISTFPRRRSAITHAIKSKPFTTGTFKTVSPTEQPCLSFTSFIRTTTYDTEFGLGNELLSTGAKLDAGWSRVLEKLGFRQQGNVVMVEEVECQMYTISRNDFVELWLE